MAVHETYDTGGNLLRVEETPDSQNEAQAVIEAVRNPDAKTPSVEDRLVALECLLVPPDEGSQG